MNKVRVGFVGSGFMGQLAHMDNYVRLDDVEMVALAEGRQKTAQEVARRYGIGKVYPDHRALLKEADIDAVVAIMGFGLHYSVIPDILAAGKHCITEKPICQNPANGWKMVKLAADNNVIYQIGYMKRCDPASILAKNLVNEWKVSGEFGDLRYMRVSMPPGDWIHGIEKSVNLGDPAPSYEGESFEATPDWMDEGTSRQYISFVNFYIHQVNLIRYLLGEDYSLEYVDKAGVLLVARSESGVPVTLEMAAYNAVDEWHEDYFLGFDKGYVKVSLPAPMERKRSGRVEIYKSTGQGAVYERPVVKPRWSMYEQARIFVDTVRGNRECISPAADAVKDLELAEDYVRQLTQG